MTTSYDIIVIGSGAGGLTAAVALAQALAVNQDAFDGNGRLVSENRPTGLVANQAHLRGTFLA